MSSPYLIEKETLIKRLMLKMPYPRSWFDKQSIHKLQAIYNKKVGKK